MNENSVLYRAIEQAVIFPCYEEMKAISDDSCEFSESYEKKIQKLIKRREKPYFNLIRTTGRRVACIIVAIVLFSASALCVKAVRDAVRKFLMKGFSDHTEIMVDSENTKKSPVVIEKEYYISALPEEFKLVDYSKMIVSITELYSRDDDYVIFVQDTKDSYLKNFDNEHSTFESYTDNDGQEYMIHNSGHSFTFIWDNGEYVFEVGSNLPKDELLNLCRSVKEKEKYNMTS